MSSASPTERATTAYRLEFQMTDIELGIERAQREGFELPLFITASIETLRERVDKAIEALTR